MYIQLYNMLEHERNSLTNCWSVQRVAWSQEERQSCHTPGEVSSASWANCWWVMMYGMEKVRLIHWMNSHDGYEQVLCTCLFVLSLVSSYIGMWHRRQGFHGSRRFFPACRLHCALGTTEPQHDAREAQCNGSLSSHFRAQRSPGTGSPPLCRATP